MQAAVKERAIMRKMQKKMAEDYIRLLGRIHDEIKKAIGMKNTGMAREMLMQAQETAINLGGLIEESEGMEIIKVNAVISLLEDYCEFVWQIYEQIGGGQDVNVNVNCNTVNGNEIHKSLSDILTRVEIGVKNDIKVRTEAVFLPYKASMWDSLESVWKAADEDPDCDAYVIPIPYYDKNADGSFKEEHYEGDLYPDYVPVTRYDEFDFEKHHPDMIFIHNPYDACNHVTSVHPFFYSKNLKQYTEKLIYIPYFVLEEVNPEDREAVKHIEDLCAVPGVIHADKVIVQSEDMRRIYVDVMTGYAGENTRKHWEDKILGLGSPKIDKVLGTRREDVETPEEWLKIINGPSGAKKKVILYNTSVSALLEHKELMTDKMRRVFRIFRENSDEIALLWRPHPLIRTTVESMLPQLWESYGSLVEQYKKEGWGIYDDSSDLNRALALSDGYYGDHSSLVPLCKSIGLPVMIQNVAD